MSNDIPRMMPPIGMDPETFRKSLGKTKEEMIALYGEPKPPQGQPPQNNALYGTSGFNFMQEGFKHYYSNSDKVESENISYQAFQQVDRGKGPVELAKALGITVEELKRLTPQEVEKLAKEKHVDLKEYGRPDKGQSYNV